jgi:hypothetical protein
MEAKSDPAPNEAGVNAFLERPGVVLTGALLVVVTLAVVALQRGSGGSGSIDEMACGSVVAPYSQTPPEGGDLGEDGRRALDALAQNLEGRGFAETFEYRLWSQDRSHLVLLGAPTQSGDGSSYSYANFELRDGSWVPTSWGGCSWQPVIEGYGVASWRLPGEVDSTASTFEVLATELSCANGEAPEGRDVTQAVVVTDSEITITVLVEPVRGGATCPGNPEFAFEIDLDEPIGDRALLDGSETPPIRRHDPLAASDCRKQQAESGLMEARVYFRCGPADLPDFRLVRRPLDTLETRSPAERTLRLLLPGPTKAELAAGYTSLFGSGTANALGSVVFDDDDGGLTVDFTDDIMANAATTAEDREWLQIELLYNVFDTAEIDHVEFHIEGSCEAWSRYVGDEGCRVYTRGDLRALQSGLG